MKPIDQPEIIVAMGDKLAETLERLRKEGKRAESISVGSSNAEYKIKVSPVRERQADLIPQQQTLPVSNDP